MIINVPVRVKILYQCSFDGEVNKNPKIIQAIVTRFNGIKINIRAFHFLVEKDHNRGFFEDSKKNRLLLSIRDIFHLLPDIFFLVLLLIGKSKVICYFTI